MSIYNTIKQTQKHNNVTSLKELYFFLSLDLMYESLKQR